MLGVKQLTKITITSIHSLILEIKRILDLGVSLSLRITPENVIIVLSLVIISKNAIILRERVIKSMLMLFQVKTVWAGWCVYDAWYVFYFVCSCSVWLYVWVRVAGWFRLHLSHDTFSKPVFKLLNCCSKFCVYG